MTATTAHANESSEVGRREAVDLLPAPDCRVKPWTTVDAGVVYSGIRNTLGLQVRNLGDKRAPFDANYEVTMAQGFNAQFHNALGRYYTVNLTYRFS